MNPRFLSLLAPWPLLIATGCGGSAAAPLVDAPPVDASVRDAPAVDASAPEDVSAAVDSPTAPDAPAIRCEPGDCGPHGRSHGSHCDCDDGFVERGGCCVPPPACSLPDDDLEENDTSATGTVVSGGALARGDLRVCPGDLDVFRVSLRTGQRVEAALRFAHANGDIDAYLFAPGTSDFGHATPLARGNSADDDERLAFTARRDGEHLLVVLGYEGAENAYALDVSVASP